MVPSTLTGIDSTHHIITLADGSDVLFFAVFHPHGGSRAAGPDAEDPRTQPDTPAVVYGCG